MAETTEADDQEAPQAERCERRLVMVHPRAQALPLPPHGEVVGRAWFHERGHTDKRISTGHLRFLTQGSVVAVEDAGSHNGTFVDGHKLVPAAADVPAERCLLYPGAVLRVGAAVLVYRDRFAGRPEPDAALGGLVGPWGLRGVAAEVERLVGTGSSRPILVRAATGTGKEALATLLAERLRPGRPVVRVNVAAIPAALFESHLFGHARGAFTGASAEQPGAFRAAHRGTLVLDEIGELPLELQPKLLRALDQGEVQGVGQGRSTPVDVLVVASTNADLDAAVEAGRFRADLRARFAWTLRLPELGERREDVLAIADALAVRAFGRGYEPEQVGEKNPSFDRN